MFATKSGVRFSLLLSAVTILAPGCTKKTNEQQAPAATTAEQVIDVKSVKVQGIDYDRRAIALNFEEEPKTLDAQKATDTVALMILGHVNEGLVRLDPANKPFGAVAETWESKSPTEYTFKLRKEAKWSDGIPVTAHDFVYSWQRAVDPKTASEYAFIMFPLKNAAEINAGKVPVEQLGVTAIDDATLQVTLANPTGHFLRLLSFGTFGPSRKDFVEKHGEKYAADADRLLYNGPFVISEWKHNASIRLTKNPTYWNKDKVWLNEINMPYLIRDENSEFNMFKDGKYSMVWQLPKELLAEAQATKQQIRKYNDGSIWYLETNTTRTIPGNKNFRKALQYAMDRNEFVRQVYGIPGTEPIYGLIPDYMPGVEKSYGEEYSVKFKDADLTKAKEYLEKAKQELGLKEFPPIGILASDTDTARRDMEYFQRFYKEKLGLDFRLDFQTFKVRLERMTRKDFDIVYAGWGPDYLDAMTFADLFTSWNGNNHTGWSSPEYDKNIRAAMDATDPKVRLDAMHAAEKILVEDAPIVSIFQRVRMYVQDPRLVGVLRRPISPDPDFYYTRISGPVAAKE